MRTGRYTVAKAADDATVMVAAGSVDDKLAELAARRYAKLLDVHLRNEAKLARMMRAWDKSRAALRRAERRMDRAMVAAAHAAAHPEPAPFDDELPAA